MNKEILIRYIIRLAIKKTMKLTNGIIFDEVYEWNGKAKWALPNSFRYTTITGNQVHGTVQSNINICHKIHWTKNSKGCVRPSNSEQPILFYINSKTF